MRDSILEVEVDTAKDSHLSFPPIGAAVRGRLDFLRLAHRDPDAIKLTVPFPKGVPGATYPGGYVRQAMLDR